MAYSDEIKVACIAALLEGQGVNQVARAHNIDKSTVSRWKKKLPPEKIQQIATKKNEDFESLLIDYVCTNLRSLTAQSAEVGKPEYIQKQDAASLATLHGVIADKTIRIISAFEPADEAG